ncbi:MAG: hypothetical protein ACI8XV_002227 [Arenicella sp.]|jgi:hypothetical protein
MIRPNFLQRIVNMDRSISGSAFKKLLVYFLTTSLLIACGGSDQSSDSPQMVSLDLMPDSEIKIGENLVVSADCKHCDVTKTRYEWKVKGIEQAVSNEDYYQIPAEHVAKEISITATAVSVAGTEGSSITRIYALNRVKEIVGNRNAFAALKFDGSVVTWGHARSGGDRRLVTEHLTNVKSIFTTINGWGRAFAAIKTDGSVVTWGEADKGGDSSGVAAQLAQVQSISATGGALQRLRPMVQW